MSTLLIIIGLLVAVALFLHFINAVDSAKRPDANAAQSPSHTSGHVLQHQQKPGSIMPTDLKEFIPERRCPLCSMTLKRDEPLYASFIESGGTKRVLIHGCPYCYKGEKKETL